MKWLEEARQKALEFFDSHEWVKWVHEGTKPAYTNAEKIANIAYLHYMRGSIAVCV